MPGEMLNYPWRVYAWIWLGMLLVSISAVATKLWVDLIFWVVGYMAILRSVRAAVVNKGGS